MSAQTGWFVAAAVLVLLVGCPSVGQVGDGGSDGSATPGPAGLACWDTDSDGAEDPSEDVNQDGVWDALDCRGSAGPVGAVGPAGASATSLMFGDGSAGAKSIGGDVRFASASEANQQWTDFVVEAGVTLTVQSGTVLRVNGDFLNLGTIIVENGSQGGDRSGFDATTTEGSSRAAALGVNTLSAGSGEVGSDVSDRSGGLGGDGISEFETRTILRVGTRAGSGGGAALDGGGAGGGGFTVLAAGEILNEGEIFADGALAADGGGGGGGGVVLLIAGARVENSEAGLICARGGAGGDSTSAAAPGGGGGGGIVHMFAPEVANAGEVDVSGGGAGGVAVALLVADAIRSGGGGGGGSGGAGGAGGDVPAGASAAPLEAGSGAAGHAIITESTLFPF